MRAVVMRRPGQPMAVEELDLAAPGLGEIVVRVEAAGVCHSDYHYLRGDIPCPLPIVLGHEGAGVVEALGPQTTGRIGIGDRVAFTWRPRCGHCAACVRGNPVLCELGSVEAASGGLLDGTTRLSSGDEAVHHFLGVSCFAERAVVAESSVVPVPDGVPAEIAAIAGCAVVTGVGAAMNVMTDAAGSSVLVVGAGGVGLSAVLGASLVGAAHIVVADIDDAKRDLAEALGATEFVVSSTDEGRARLGKLAAEDIRWAIDAVGRPATMRSAFDALSAEGTLIALGLSAADDVASIPINALVQRQRRVVGALYGGSNPITDLPRIFELYRRGRLPLDLLIGKRYELAQVGDAYADLLGGAVGRGIVIP